MKNDILRSLALALAASLAACKAVDVPVPKVPGVTPYRMVIQQGNFISQEMVAQLKPGMTKEQVRFVLGTPLVTDIFHADRWDYVFYREMPTGKREQRNLSVVFEKDRLARVIGDLMPEEGGKPAAAGFTPLLQPEPPGKPGAKPAEGGKPPADAPKPAEAPKAASAAAEKPHATTQNWGTASEGAEKKAEPATEAKPATPSADGGKKPDDDKKSSGDGEGRGFFGRMLEKIGL